MDRLAVSTHPLSHLSTLVDDRIQTGITPLLSIFRDTCAHSCDLDFDLDSPNVMNIKKYPPELDEAERDYARAMLLKELSLPQQSYLKSAKEKLIRSYQQYTNYSEIKIAQVMAFFETFFPRVVGGGFSKMELRILRQGEAQL